MAKGKIPSDKELVQWLHFVGRELYPERPNWAPSSNYYSHSHPPGWCGPGRMLGMTTRQRGIGRAWRSMVWELCRLHVPTSSEITLWQNERAMVKRYGQPVKLAEQPKERIGIPVFERRKARTVWDHKRQIWRVETYTAMVVR